jgi:arylsulfatase A-like enzyme
MKERAARRSAFTLATLFFSAVSLLSCGCGRSRPNIVLIVIDTLRADRLGCYGSPVATSPGIDRLAARSTRFENAYTTAPWTLPAFASLLTSTYPWEHGAVNDYLAPRPELPAIAEVLRGAGYETAGFVSHIYTSRTYGFDRGFDRFEDFGIGEGYVFDQGREPRAERVVGEAIRWLGSREKSGPYFLLVHLFDPHWDYAAPEPFRARFDDAYGGSADGSYRTIARYLSPDSIPDPRDLAHIRALYDGEIAYTDAWVDTLLCALERERSGERTAIFLTADHGEEFRDHESMGHSFTFFDEVLRVPLLYRSPDGSGAGEAVTVPVSLLDLLPSIAKLAGLDPPAGARGRPLGDALRAEPRLLEAGTIREGRYGKAVLSGSRKLIWDRGGFRLFDRSRDPEEKVDLFASGTTLDDTSFAAMLARIHDAGAETSWHLSWDTPPAAEGGGVSGKVAAHGILVDLLPLPGLSPGFDATNNVSLSFRSSSSGGIRFRIVPPEGRVTFQLAMDGEERPDRIYIGRDSFHPPAARFGLDPSATPAGTLSGPAVAGEPGGSFLLWKSGDPPPPRLITLTDEEEARLRLLGYLN